MKSMARPMRVEDLMSTAVVTVRDSEPLASADLEMKLGSFRHIPVVDDKENLVGLLSARDLLGALGRGKNKKKKVGECMSRKVVSVTPEVPVPVAIDLLLENQFGCLPVVGNDGRLMGIVTETDFLQAARQVFAGARPSVREPS